MSDDKEDFGPEGKDFWATYASAVSKFQLPSPAKDFTVFQHFDDFAFFLVSSFQSRIRSTFIGEKMAPELKDVLRAQWGEHLSALYQRGVIDKGPRTGLPQAIQAAKFHFDQSCLVLDLEESIRQLWSGAINAAEGQKGMRLRISLGEDEKQTEGRSGPSNSSVVDSRTGRYVDLGDDER